MTAVATGSRPALTGVDERPPGERYYRHPGDVVRLVVWGSTSVLLVLFVAMATETSDGVRDDLGGAASEVPEAVRQLVLAATQMGALVVPVLVVGALCWQRRWRRLSTMLVAALAGALLWLVVETVLDDTAAVPGALADEAWLGSLGFPSLTYLAAATAAGIVGKPWLSRRWRRMVDTSLVGLAAAMGVAGLAGVPELLLATALGAFAGAAILAAAGAPNRRPTASAVVAALGAAGITVHRLDLQRVAGGRSQLYRAIASDETLFLKVYGQDTRDADLLYRTYRGTLLRDAGGVASVSVIRDVEHEALLLLLARRADVACPELRAVVALADDSVVLAMDDVGGSRLDALRPEELDAPLLTAVWREVVALHRAGLAHGALRAANVLVSDGPQRRVTLIDLGAGATAASARTQAIDRAELLASIAILVGPDAALASILDVVETADVVAATPYLQPLALSTATRRGVSKSTLAALRAGIAERTGTEPVPLERLIRVRPRTVVTVATLTGAFYVLLPQLANVGDSVVALRSANFGWLAVAVVMSGSTYVAAGIGLMGGVQEDLPFVMTVEASLASSFVNRVTPANVGGMALNVRFMQKAGIPPAEAVAGVGLNVLAGGIVHVGLLAAFVAWAGRGGAGFSIPASSKLLVIVALVLALVGLALATKWGRDLARSKVMPTLRQSAMSIGGVARSPARLAALFGGSAGVTMGYITALACSVAAFDGGVSYAEVGAVYLGASLIAAAAPTPGGLGAVEAALVAGLTGIGLDPGLAVAAVLSYRLLTFWLPILPGWLYFQLLERRGVI